jgi:undecaprenyl-diphosphatase
MESWGIAVILGILEGLTEFVPVSSTGHLIIAGHVLGFTGEKAAVFEVAIQFGAILSVVFLYWQRFLRLINIGANSQSHESNLSGWAGLLRIGLATAPALVIGYLARNFIKTHLFTPLAVSCALAAGGVAIIIVEHCMRGRPGCSLEKLTLGQALGVGCFQVLSLWPGTSRAAATIVGGMILGLERKGAAEFSFLIAVPIMLAVELYEVSKMSSLFTAQDTAQFLIGFAVSFIVALFAVKSFILFLSRWNLVPFAWYRIVIAPVFFLLTRGGGLK